MSSTAAIESAEKRLFRVENHCLSAISTMEKLKQLLADGRQLFSPVVAQVKNNELREAAGVIYDDIATRHVVTAQKDRSSKFKPESVGSGWDLEIDIL